MSPVPMDLPPVYMDVPAYVQHVDNINNHIVVKGGTNWDLSRSAVATPITPIVAPQAVAPPLDAYRSVVSQEPRATVRFSLNSVVVPTKASKVLQQLPKGVTVTVSGHAETRERNAPALAKKRADEVARRMRKLGATVEQVSSSADGNSSSGAVNRKVDVFVK